MPIHGLTDRQKLPRLGKIHLGEQVQNNRGRSYPRATEWFVVPPEVAAVHGDHPRVLEPVFIPVEDEDAFASTYYRYYTQTFGLTCKGDGQRANRIVDLAHLKRTGEPAPASSQTRKPQNYSDQTTARMEVNCPCPLLDSRDCRPIMCLQVVLPKVPGIGVWQIDTSSINSIKNILGFIKIAKRAVGRISGIPLRLSLVPMETTPEGQSKKTIRVLELSFAQQFSLQQLEEYVGLLPEVGFKELPAPDDERPALVSPTPEEREAANQEASKAERLRNRKPPEGMTIEQFEQGMERLGWTWQWVFDLAALPIDLEDMDVSAAMRVFIESESNQWTWAKLWAHCQEKSQERPTPAAEAPQQEGLFDSSSADASQ